MPKAERKAVIICLQKIADTKSVSWWMWSACLKASGMLKSQWRRHFGTYPYDH